MVAREGVHRLGELGDLGVDVAKALPALPDGAEEDEEDRQAGSDDGGGGLGHLRIIPSVIQCPEIIPQLHTRETLAGGEMYIARSA